MSDFFSFGGFQAAPGVNALKETMENAFYWADHPLLLKGGGTLVSTAADSGNSSTDVLRPGLLLGKIYSTGKFKEWNPTGTDGSQYIAAILDNPGAKMNDSLAAGRDRWRGSLILKGQVKPERLLIPGQASVGISGNAYEYLIRAQLHQQGFVVYEEPTSSSLLNASRFLGGFSTIQAKTADYTVNKYESGTLFTTRGAGAAVVFTLPSAQTIGLWYGFFCAADQSMTITSGTADKMTAFNDLTADSIAFSTASEKIGGAVIVIADGTGWLVFPYTTGLGLTAQTATIAT